MDLCFVTLIIVLIAFILFIIKCCDNDRKLAIIETKRQIDTFSLLSDVNRQKGVHGYTDIDAAYVKPFVIKNFITQNDCHQIMNYAGGRLEDSEIIGGKVKSVRNSQQCWIPKNNPLAKPIFERVSRMYNIPFENAEDLQVVRYLPNQYYNEHHDSCCDSNSQCDNFAKRGGQRIITVLIYLNSGFADGETYFKNLDLKVKPPAGDAIVFFPLAQNSNKCHPLALHAGMPVTSGTKWIANVWFRERRF